MATIALINDDPTAVARLTLYLRTAGHTVVSWTDPVASLRELAQLPVPDLIVSDLYMPEIDGWRLIRTLRSPAFPAFRTVPIVVVSATHSGADVDEISSQLGADAFLPAPVDRQRFLATLTSLLSATAVRHLDRLLVVEDSRSAAAAVAEEFRGHGYEVDIAGDLSSARALIEENRYAVAVIDYNLPDGTGDELLPLLRRERGATVCIMVSAASSPELMIEWMRAGANATLGKPFDPSYLAELVTRARREESLLRVETELDHRTRELHEREALYRGLFEHSSDAIMQTDEIGRVVAWNPAAEELTGHAAEDVLGLGWEDLTALLAVDGKNRYGAHARQRLRQEVQDALETGVVPPVFETHATELQRADGTRRAIERKVFMVPGTVGFRLGAVVRDVTVWALREQAQGRATRQRSGLVECAHLLFTAGDDHRRRALAPIRDALECSRLLLVRLEAGDRRAVIEVEVGASTTADASILEVVDLVSTDGEAVWMDHGDFGAVVAPVHTTRGLWGYLIAHYPAAETITGGSGALSAREQVNAERVATLATAAGLVSTAIERDDAMAEVARMLDEKQLLLRESHHRIKNDLAMVMSLLSLTAATSTNDEVVTALRSAGARVETVSRIYDLLTYGDDVSHVEVTELVDRLVALHRSAGSARGPGSHTIAVTSSVDRLDRRRAVYLGIILNELLANAVKHGGASGAITVTIATGPRESVELIVEQVGTHFPESVISGSATGLGLRIVRMLSEQDGGSFDLANRGDSARSFAILGSRDLPHV